MRNLFAIQQPLFSPDPDPGERLPPDPGDGPPARPAKLQCEFCECHLTPTGDVLRVSQKARDLNKQREKIESHAETIAAHERTIADLRAKLAEHESRQRRGLPALEI